MNEKVTRSEEEIRNEEATRAAAEGRSGAPKLEASDIDAAIVKREFVVFNETHTVCCLTLRNGFSVIGESACVSPANFKKQLGEDLAFQDARRKVWELEGYKLREELYTIRKARDVHTSADTKVHS